MELIQQFDLLASSLGGVAKLRELILSLAVRGKLVPQDPVDEPASVLLQKIRAEKVFQIKGKVIRKGKPLPDVAEEECTYDLPNEWRWVRLGEIGDWGAGATPARSNTSYYGGAIPWFKSGELISDFISESEETVTDLALEECSLRANKIGDVLVAMYGATIGKTAILSVPGTTNQAVCACTPFSGVENRYLLLLMKALKPYFISQGAGGAQPNISREKIIATVIGLPPTGEQSRIVAKVDELMSLCDRLEAEQGQAARVQGHWVEAALAQLADSADANEFARHWQHLAQHFDTLFTTPDSITQLEATLLQLAVRGKLVPQDPNDEPASTLLQKIRTEKDRLLAEGKIKKDKPLPPISDEEKPFELPEGWAYARTYQIGESRLGKMLDQAKNSGSAHPYLRNTNVQWNRFELGDIKEIFLENHELDEYRLRNGDLLVCEGGEPGRCAIWRDEISDMYFQKALHRIRFFGNVLPEYFAICLEIDAKTGRLDQFFTGATIKHFAGQELNRYFVPLPPVAEQSRIVAKLESLFALTAGLKTQLAKAQQTQALLADVLLETSI